MSDKIKSGGKNNFYKFPQFVKDVDSLARHLKLNFAEGNILKTLTSKIGVRHEATNQKREAEKCLHYAIERCLIEGFEIVDINKQVERQLKEEV